MKIYRVQPRDNYDESQGYVYFSSKRKANKFKVKCKYDAPNNTTDILVEEIEFSLNKKGVLTLLNRWASHPDNG